MPEETNQPQSTFKGGPIAPPPTTQEASIQKTIDFFGQRLDQAVDRLRRQNGGDFHKPELPTVKQVLAGEIKDEHFNITDADLDKAVYAFNDDLRKRKAAAENPGGEAPAAAPATPPAGDPLKPEKDGNGGDGAGQQ